MTFICQRKSISRKKPHFGINFAQKFKFFSNILCEINSLKDKIPIQNFSRQNKSNEWKSKQNCLT